MSSKPITTFYQKSSSSKRSRSRSESGLSPTNKRQNYAADDINVDSDDIPVWAKYFGHLIKKMITKVDCVDARLNQISMTIDSKMTTMRNEYTKKIEESETKLNDHMKESDAKISSLTQSVEFLSAEHDDMKKTIESHILRIDELESAQDTLRYRYLKSEENFDSLEQYGRRNCLLVHGVDETENEDTNDVVVKCAADIGVTIRKKDISRSHRLGKPRQDGKGRPIIARFVRYEVRARIYSAKRGFKGQNRMITESLTRTRMGRLRRAMERYGKTNVWTMDGEIWVMLNGRKTKYHETEYEMA